MKVLADYRFEDFLCCALLACLQQLDFRLSSPLWSNDTTYLPLNLCDALQYFSILILAFLAVFILSLLF